MQPCFFALADVLPVDRAIELVKAGVVKAYGHRGPEVVERNMTAIDAALAGLQRNAARPSPLSIQARSTTPLTWRTAISRSCRPSSPGSATRCR